MFLNLSKGNILYGLDRREKQKLFTASIESINPTYNSNNPNMFGQLPELRMDIVAIINGEQREFKQVPANNAIADFGENSFVIADNKDSLYNYVNNLLKESQRIVETAPLHEAKIPQYKDILSQLSPSNVATDEVKELKDEVSSLKDQLAEMLSLLKETNK